MRQIRQVLEAEITDLHARYLERRDAALASADRIVADLERPLVPAAAGVLAVTGAEIARRRWASRRSTPAFRIGPGEADVSVRVPMPLLTRAK